MIHCAPFSPSDLLSQSITTDLLSLTFDSFERYQKILNHIIMLAAWKFLFIIFHFSSPRRLGRRSSAVVQLHNSPLCRIQWSVCFSRSEDGGSWVSFLLSPFSIPIPGRTFSTPGEVIVRAQSVPVPVCNGKSEKCRTPLKHNRKHLSYYSFDVWNAFILASESR